MSTSTIARSARRARLAGAAALALAVVAPAEAAAPPAKPAPPAVSALPGVTPFDPTRHSQAPTDCDRLAAHPDDPNRVAPGRARADIDLPAAIAACEAAVREDPSNPRLNYQLARVYGYSGQGAKALPYRRRATDGDYPQALFVVGYITLLGMNEQPQDTCAAAELIRRSALQGRLAGQLGFVHWVLAGTFDACPVRRDAAELRAFLAAARAQLGGDFYRTLLADALARELDARMPAVPPPERAR